MEDKIAALILDKLTGIEQRLAALEKMAHPQHVMADSELTNAIKELGKRNAFKRDPATVRLC